MPAHEHDYEWTTGYLGVFDTERTSILKCKICGDVKNARP